VFKSTWDVVTRNLTAQERPSIASLGAIMALQRISSKSEAV
jgi:hypothetical protein